MTVTLLTSRSRTPVAEATVRRLEEVQRHAHLIARRVWWNHNPEELAHRATVRYWETFGEGRGPASVHTWLGRTLHRLAVNDDSRPHRRREVRPLPAALYANDAETDQLLRELANPSQTALRNDLLRRLLGRVEGPDLQVLRMRMAGQSSQRVAASLCITPMAVAQACARARRRLKLAIAAEPGLLRQLRSCVPHCGNDAVGLPLGLTGCLRNGPRAA